MAVLVRLFDFAPGTLIQSQQVDDEFNQIINLLSGVSTTKNIIQKYSDATNPPLTVEQLSTGAIQSWRASATDLAKIRNDGSFQTAGAAIYDNNVNELLKLTATASAVNELTLANAATGNSPQLNPTGGDTNIGFSTTLKGTGAQRTISGSAGNNSTLRVDQNDGNPRIQLGTHNSSQTNGQITFGNQTPTDSNYGFLGNTTDTVLNTGSSTGIVSLRIAGAFSPPALQVNGASGNAIGINRSTPGAMVDILSSATSRIGLIVDTPASPTVDIAQFKNNGVTQLTFKNNGQIVGIPKNIKTDSSTVGNITTGLDDLHSFSLPAGSLNANGDYLRVRYSGLLANNTNTKRIVVSFGGVTVQDTGLFACGAAGASWTYDIIYHRLSSTSVRATLIGAWNFITRDTGGVMGGNGFLFALNIDLTGLSDLGANAATMKVQAESGAGATDDIKQNLSVIELTQNT